MKNFSSLIKIFFFGFLCIQVLPVFSQLAVPTWMINPYDEKVFIENKGQFAAIESELHCTILYAFEQGNTTFFLCKDQFIVREAKYETELASEKEEHDPATKHFPAPSFSYFTFSFANETASAIITGEKKSKATQKYFLPDAPGNKNMITANAFSQVVYRNLYNGIDVIFSAHEKNGLKYQYVVHPFADASLIRINYSGSGNLQLDEAGNLLAGTLKSEILDHAPKTFYEDDGRIFTSFYSVQGNSYSILTDHYNHSKTIVIDPWVVDPNFIDENKAFDIAGDAAGNVYAFGGHSPWQLKKFDPNGNAVWTFNTSFNEWYGALAVDPGGNSIITAGCCSGNMIRLDSSGDVTWNIINGVDEYWRLAYNCDFSNLYLATGYASSPGLLFESISLLDTASGDISNSTAIFTDAEPRSISCGLDGNIYAISCTGGFASNRVTAISPSFNVLFNVSSDYNLLYNGPLFANGANSTAGQNGISCGFNFFCTSNGSTLYKRDKNNGGVISSIAISGGSAEENSGILVDSCDNIYVGSSDAVIKYDSSFNVISTTATTGAVYCLAPSVTGALLVSGNGFIASMDLAVCRDIFCIGTSGNQGGSMFAASDAAICEKFCVDYFDSSTNNPTSWYWNFPGGNPSFSTDQNPTNICYAVPGTYDVTLITTNGNGSDTLTLPDYITVYETPPFPSITQVGYTLTSSVAISYQWQLNAIDIPGATDQSYTVQQSGMYTVIISDANGCQNSFSTYVVISGIDDAISNDGIFIFPNPVSDKLLIQASSINSNEATTISIINVLGQKVLAQNITWKNHPEFDVKNLASGIYFIQVETEQEKFSARFVKE